VSSPASGTRRRCRLAIEEALDDDLQQADDDGDNPDASQAGDVAAVPNESADPDDLVRRKLPASILAKYEVYSYRNAALILAETRKAEFDELVEALESFSLTTTQIRMPGGNESEIPKTFNASLRPKGWYETVIRGDLVVTLTWKEEGSRVDRRGRTVATQTPRSRQTLRERFLDGHKIDYVKNRVAFDLEWNSKDQTFDRDLYAFSAFSQCGVVDAAVLVTRSAELNAVFRTLGPALLKDGSIDGEGGKPKMLIHKYGASTTWMGKLLYRLNAGRNGSCPVLALGIRPACISDWSES